MVFFITSSIVLRRRFRTNSYSLLGLETDPAGAKTAGTGPYPSPYPSPYSRRRTIIHGLTHADSGAKAVYRTVYTKPWCRKPISICCVLFELSSPCAHNKSHMYTDGRRTIGGRRNKKREKTHTHTHNGFFYFRNFHALVLL